MKKVLFTLLVGCMLAVVACGPSAEEKAKMEQAKQDSIAKDSMAAAQAAAQAASQAQAANDSMSKADTTKK